ncbi:MAG: NAD-dependent epimerase/dehydratase family protein [Myxococcota bacterium]
MKVCLVTGGGGYLGRSLARALASRGHIVRVFDVAFPQEPPSGVEAIVGDIRNEAEVAAACENVDTVFHCAALINTVTLARASVRKQVFDVNVGGTQNVIAACQMHNVPRLVFTSSISVVVDRDPVPAVDESAPYASTEPMDLYTATKLEAERIVLAANSPTLSTCALRPGGIYGPGEGHHFPRIVREVLGGRFVATVGRGLAKADNVYIDDLIDVHLRAAERLEPASPVAGKAYQVGDGNPISYFEFFRPVVEHLGYRFPRFWVPAGLMMVVSFFAELFHFLGGPFPFMTRMEVRKLNIDNYSSIDAAKDDLGWVPEVDPREGMRRSMSWVDELAAMLPRVRRPHLGWWLAIGVGLGLTFALALSDSAWGVWTDLVGTFLPRIVIQGIAIGAAILHVGEGAYAYVRARAAGLPTAGGWGFQTLLLGYPSLRLLLAEVRDAHPTLEPTETT